MGEMMDKDTLTLKVSRYNRQQLHHAIADCHYTLRLGQYEYTDPYAQKLWAEIDACRDRLMGLSIVKKGSAK